MVKKTDQHLFKQFKNKLKREKRVVFTWQLAILIVFFSIWEIASQLYWIDPLLFSSPTRIFHLLLTKFSDGSMITHVQITLFETVLGFIIGTLLGIITASLLWSSPRLSKIMDPYLVILNAMPKVALGPIMRSEEHTSELQSRGHIIFR